jgi:hypothetical protein
VSDRDRKDLKLELRKVGLEEADLDPGALRIIADHLERERRAADNDKNQSKPCR